MIFFTPEFFLINLYKNYFSETIQDATNFQNQSDEKDNDKNEDNLKKYSEVAIPILKKYGGVPLVRGGKYKSFSGSEFSRTVIWEFPSLIEAINCHDSKEYQSGWALAKDTTERNLQIVEGFNIE